MGGKARKNEGGVTKGARAHTAALKARRKNGEREGKSSRELKEYHREKHLFTKQLREQRDSGAG